MSNTATINRGGDLLSLTAQRGGTVLVSLHSVNPAGHLTGLSVPGAQLRAALDAVAPAGSYTRTDEEGTDTRTREHLLAEEERLRKLEESLRAHLSRTINRAEKAEQERDEMCTERDAWEERLTSLVYSLATVEEVGEWSSGNELDQALIDHMQGKIQRLERSAAQPRPLTADDITDEARDRAYRAVAALSVSDWDDMTGVAKGRAMALVEAVITEITRPEPPTRPEGAEELARLIATADVGEWDCGDLADALLATGRVRVVTEEQP